MHKRVTDTHYVLDLSWSPHPFQPLFEISKYHRPGNQRTNGRLEGRLPDAILARVEKGSNAMGAFYEFIKDKEVALIDVKQLVMESIVERQQLL